MIHVFKHINQFSTQLLRKRANRKFRKDLRLALSKEVKKPLKSDPVISRGVDADQLWLKLNRSITRQESQSAARIIDFRRVVGAIRALPLPFVMAMLFLGAMGAYRLNVEDGDFVSTSSSPHSHQSSLEQEVIASGSLPLTQLSHNLSRVEFGHCNPSRQSCIGQNFL